MPNHVKLSPETTLTTQRSREAEQHKQEVTASAQISRATRGSVRVRLPMDFLALQRTIGNQAISRLLNQKRQHQLTQKEKSNMRLPNSSSVIQSVPVIQRTHEVANYITGIQNRLRAYTQDGGGCSFNIDTAVFLNDAEVTANDFKNDLWFKQQVRSKSSYTNGDQSIVVHDRWEWHDDNYSNVDFVAAAAGELGVNDNPGVIHFALSNASTDPFEYRFAFRQEFGSRGSREIIYTTPTFELYIIRKVDSGPIESNITDCVINDWQRYQKSPDLEGIY